jgi:hypothetical protein
MANTSITIYPQYNSNQITNINCGTSSPRISGTIDISSFPNLSSFTCTSNDITSFQGFAECEKLATLNIVDNKLNDNFNDIFPNISNRINLRVFDCSENDLTGPIPSLSGLPNLTDFGCRANLLTGPIPSLSGLSNLKRFFCHDQLGTKLTGAIPSLNNNSQLTDFFCHTNSLTGSIPSLTNNVNLNRFHCGVNQLSGNIPNLTPNINLLSFYCNNNFLSGYDGGSISANLGTFVANSNQLTQSAVDAILSAFDATTRTTGTKILSLQTGNSAPSYTGGVTTTSLGSNFSRTGTLVTANVNNHAHTNGNLVTITGIPQTAFQGTFTVTVTGPNQFQYTTVTSGSITGTGTATMRRTTNDNDGFRSYQNLALVTRLGGFPWNVSINFP